MKSIKKFWLIIILVSPLLFVPYYSGVSNTKSIGLNIGDYAPDFEFKNKDGKTVKLSDFKGKVVLIDFWASWCGYCRIANPDLVQSYERFKQYGFEIISISLDKEKADWESAIEEDELTWPHHFCDFKVWKSEIAISYGVNDTGIPYSFLINEDGIIVDKEINSIQLNKKLKWLYVDQVYFYPKKATENIYFSQKVKFAIVDINGSIVMKGKDEKVDISSLKKGYYFIEFDGKKESLIKRDPTDENITFYPKNVSNKITLSEEASYEIYNNKGKLIKKGKSKDIDVTDLDLTPGKINYLSIGGTVHEFLKK